MNLKNLKIGDICLTTDYVANGSFASLSKNVQYLNDDGYAILIRLTDFVKKWEKSFRYVSKHAYEFLKHSKLFPGDLIISNVGEPGKTFLVPDLKKPMTLGPNSILIRPDKNILTTQYLKYFLDSEFGQKLIKSIVSGTAQSKFNKTSFRKLEIPVPLLKEQQRIVAKLDTAFAEIDKEINASKNKQKIVDSLKKNILAKKFELDSDVIKLGDLCEVITKGTTPTSLGYKFIDKGINFIKIESITNIGNFIKNKFAYINKDCNAALKRSQLQAGDILFSIAGALGRTAIVTEEILPANTNQALAILRIKKDIKIDKKFLLHCLNSDVVKKQSDTFKGGTAQQNLSLSQLKSYNIPLPSLVKQKDIVTKLDLIFTEIHKLKNLIEMKIKNYQTLSYAILKKELQKETA